MVTIKLSFHVVGPYTSVKHITANFPRLLKFETLITFRWYREHEGRLQAVRAGRAGSEQAAGSLAAWAGGAAMCGRAAAELAGAWLCKAYNGFGDAALQLRLHVEAELSVAVSPPVVVSIAALFH